MKFIKNPLSKTDYDNLFYSPAIKFRRRFSVCEKNKAILSVCGLGYGYFFINGKRVSDDLFVSPVSDYNKTLWYTRYDVTSLLQEGENVLCVHLGNGFYNENFETPWKHNEAKWRDVPKLSLTLEIGDFLLESDALFVTKLDDALYYNQLRSGEYYDSRKEEDWLSIEFDDSSWVNAIVDDNNPKGVERFCDCESIRECRLYNPVNILKNTYGYIFDFGQNFSGYAELFVNEPAGTEIVLEYAEEIDEKINLKLNNLDVYYPSVPFQTDKFICDGSEQSWKPKFTFHGFRYVQVKGLTKEPTLETLKGYFVHQDVKKTGEFSCSNEMINKIYNAGIMASWSNMFYSLTDCPTREKLGWTNDAAASMEQLFLNFDCEKFFVKWAQDIIDAMREDGALPGIIPSPDYGYELGPITDAILFELPYRMYLHTGNKEVIEKMYPYCLKYFDFLKRRFDNKIWFLLSDWTGLRNKATPSPFLHRMLAVAFLKKTIFMANVLGEDKTFLESYKKQLLNDVKEEFIKDGDCIIEEQTALSMCICEGLGDIAKLKNHLLNLIRNDENHLNCGMIGTQYIYKALSLIGEHNLVIDMILQPTPPSFAFWINNGATTLYETFVNEYTDSKNHHMFSNIIGWFTTDVLGLTVLGKNKISFKPKLFDKIDNAKGFITLDGNKLEAEVIKNGSKLYGKLTIPKESVFIINDKFVKGEVFEYEK